ncbi:hypothetical protein [Tateyamaria omphalii]|uniref:hypothetical protein n=1 Tax=Tateyamaria omphalii TaxID=299262 RepID=UPI0012FA9D04|nr:hypothetical protein [Tateyamaria omphalii]
MVWFLIGSSVFAQNSFIDDLRVVPTVVCAEVPVLERLKYDDCIIPYFQTDLPAYLEELVTARQARLQAERDRVWDWLELLPKPNCENVPSQERPKFFFHCDPPDISVDLVGSLQARLESLKADRNMMAERINQLRVKYDQLVAERGPTPSGVNAREIQVLTETLQALDQTLVRVGLIEQLTDALAAKPDLPPIEKLSFAQVSSDLALYVSQHAGSVALGTAGTAGQTVIKIETAGLAPRNVIIVHPVLGLGYTSQSDLDAE